MLVCLYDASTVKRHQTFHLFLDKIKNSYFVKGEHFLFFSFSLAYIYGWGNWVQLICPNITMRALWGLDVKMPSFGRAVACHYVIHSPSSLNILCSLLCKPYSLQELHRKRRMDQITNSREHEGTRRWTESQTTWKKPASCLTVCLPMAGDKAILSHFSLPIRTLQKKNNFFWIMWNLVQLTQTTIHLCFFVMSMAWLLYIEDWKSRTISGHQIQKGLYLMSSISSI